MGDKTQIMVHAQQGLSRRQSFIFCLVYTLYKLNTNRSFLLFDPKLILSFGANGPKGKRKHKIKAYNRKLDQIKSEILSVFGYLNDQNSLSQQSQSNP